jgi:hypothetical protein
MYNVLFMDCLLVWCSGTLLIYLDGSSAESGAIASASPHVCRYCRVSLSRFPGFRFNRNSVHPCSRLYNEAFTHALSRTFIVHVFQVHSACATGSPFCGVFRLLRQKNGSAYVGSGS